MIDDLRRLAEPAMAGPWRRSRFVESLNTSAWTKRGRRPAGAEALLIRGPGIVGTPGCNPVAAAQSTEDRDYIAALPPEVILALLDRLAALEAVADAAAKARATAPADYSAEWDALDAALARLKEMPK
jgi:hypothetical protein